MKIPVATSTPVGVEPATGLAEVSEHVAVARGITDVYHAPEEVRGPGLHAAQQHAPDWSPPDVATHQTPPDARGVQGATPAVRHVVST